MLFRSLQIAAAVAIFGCSAVLVHAQSLDSVYSTKGGAPSKGTVTDAMTKDSVTLDMAGVPRVFQISEIARITFGDEPQELANARNSVFAKNYGSAIEELKKIPAGSLVRPVMLQDAQYYMPIEDPTVEWSEKISPFESVARITVQPQDFDSGYAATAAPEGSMYARVRHLEGRVTILANDADMDDEVTINTPVAPGDMIETGSSGRVFRNAVMPNGRSAAKPPPPR